MRRIRIFAIVILVCAIWVPASFAAALVGHVFIVSVDGGKPSVFQQTDMPVLSAMVAEGAVTWRAQTVFPSVTLVAHTSMLTGVQPAKHGIDWNDWKPDRGVVQVPTVFSTAKANGFSTSMFIGKEKLKHLDIPGSLDLVSFPAYEEGIVADHAAKYIVERRPNLCFIHFADPDGAGHKYGWGSTEQKAVIAEGDRALGRVKAAIVESGLSDDAVIIVTADHGGHAKTHGSDSPEDMTIPWIVWGKGVKKNFTIEAPVSTCDTAATALWLLSITVPSDWDGKPVRDAFDLPQH